ncbi:MAG: hypothetical protein A3H28_14910 [Acidobacteria bacterium RIFCSPLOWO2_02_FULL_61_28]|nr:MAG: hypothetical protein A3H28_14910 [Acidobacteria bacterium RIFCSPLOWO2_02_FULL_61_28]
MRRLVPLLVAGLVLVTTMSLQAQDSPQTIYVYRYKEGGGFLNVKFPIYLDDREVARIENGRFFVIRVKPGDHILRSNDKQSGIQLSAQQTFIRIEPCNHCPGWKVAGRVSLEGPEQAVVELKKLKYSDAKDIKDNNLVLLSAPPTLTSDPQNQRP